MSAKRRIDTGGGGSLGQNPFDALKSTDLPPGPTSSLSKDESSSRQARRPVKNRGRIEIRREKSGRGGKTVTTATKFEGVCPAEQEGWVSDLRKRCGAGGTSRPGAIEIQGDRRDDLVRFFEEKGFRPVLAGG